MADWAHKPLEDMPYHLQLPDVINARGETRLARKIRCIWEGQHISALRWVKEMRGDTIWLFLDTRDTRRHYIIERLSENRGYVKWVDADGS